MEPNADELHRVYSQLAAMRKNLNQMSFEWDADRFHEQLDRLDRAGYDVAEIRLDPERDMYRKLQSISGQGEKRYADTKTVHLGVLESKLDAVLMYFEGSGSEEPMGFAAPRKR